MYMQWRESVVHVYVWLYSTAKIQGLKKAVPKGDKKRKKEATAEITKLEEEFKKLENLKVTLDVPEDVASEETDVSSAQELLNAVSLDEKQEVGVGTGSKKKSKAQKRKVKRHNYNYSCIVHLSFFTSIDLHYAPHFMFTCSMS